MRMHDKNTAWTLDPTQAYPENKDKHGLQRGEGNMVSAEFNLLYRFHSPISKRDAWWAEEQFLQFFDKLIDDDATADELVSGQKFTTKMIRDGEIPMQKLKAVFGYAKMDAKKEEAVRPKMDRPCFPEGLDSVGGKHLADYRFKRDPDGEFDDDQIAAELIRSIEDPMCQYGAQNVPRVLKVIEVMGILQARKWEMATLNEFREFFEMFRHETFADINSDPKIQQRLRDLYEDPDMVEFYPKVFIEGKGRSLDPGGTCPGERPSALWRGAFSDAVTLVRSDRFYTIDFNIDTYTAWGVDQMVPNNKIQKGSVLYRLFTRGLPGHFAYDQIHMWQPFYTRTRNVVLAEQQGHINQFDFTCLEDQNGEPWAIKNVDGKIEAGYFERACERAAKRRKVQRVLRPGAADYKTKWRGKFLPRGNEYADKLVSPPITIRNYNTIRNILAQPIDWVKPGTPQAGEITSPFREILTGSWDNLEAANDVVRKTLKSGWEEQAAAYFTGLAQDIRLREQREFQKLGQEQVYQLDVVKDYIIPVVTRFLADFVGFWEQVKTPEFQSRKFNENQIYQHIQNFEAFRSYEADPTKMGHRRSAFRDSAKALIDLAADGIQKSSYLFLEHGILGSGIFRREHLYGYAGDATYIQNMRKIGVELVHALSTAGLANREIAAFMLHHVLEVVGPIATSFIETLAFFIDPKTQLGDDGKFDKATNEIRNALWKEVQDIVWNGPKAYQPGGKVICSNSDKTNESLANFVREAQRFNHVDLAYVYMPKNKAKNSIALENSMIDENGNMKPIQVTIKRGDTVLLDLDNSYHTAPQFSDPSTFNIARPVPSYLVLGHTDSFTSRLTLTVQTSPLKHLAQLKYLRVAHDKLGRLKRMRTPEGLVGYTSVQWDQLLPSPTTWNLRFDGVGKGVFKGGDNADQGRGMGEVWIPIELPADELEVEGKGEKGEGKEAQGFVGTENGSADKGNCKDFGGCGRSCRWC